MDHWNRLHLEGYCFINIDYDMKHSKYLYEVTDFDKMKTKKVPNSQYDKTCKPNKKPKKCKGHINMDCVKCIHFAYTDIEDELKKRIDETIEKYENEVE